MTEKAVSTSLVDALRVIVGRDHLRVGDSIDALDPGVNPDNLGTRIIASPSSTEEVAAIIHACRNHKVPIVTHGGLTGLVGGGVSHRNEVVISMRRMAKIHNIDPIERVAVVDAGVTLETLQHAAAEVGLEPGIDLASRGSATIGGMASTNAGGVMAFRNGVMRHRIFGLEAVMPDGMIMSDLTRVVKVAAGYDIKHLLIGAEGTLGIITRLAIRLDPLPKARATALFGCSSVNSALRLVQHTMQKESGRLRMAEAMWTNYLRLTMDEHRFSDSSVDRDCPVSLLIQLGGDDEDALRGALESLYADHVEEDPNASGTIAQTLAQERALLMLREDTDAIYRKYKAAPSYDVSVPQSELSFYIDRVMTELAQMPLPRSPFVFGHVADGNLHIVMDCSGPVSKQISDEIEAIIYKDIAKIGGSFSAEHGVGSKRTHSLLTSVNPVKIAAMRSIKSALDPENLFNPGKVLPLQ